MSEHTPGPWEYLGHTWVQTADDKKTPIANFNFLAATKANARLIAAAPDLLEALVMVRDADEDCKRDGLPTIPPAARAKIDAAIAKATGAPE